MESWYSYENCSYILAYEPGRQQGEHLHSCTFDRIYDKPHVCPFTLEHLGSTCTKANYFGYDVGKPCVLLKINRVSIWIDTLIIFL